MKLKMVLLIALIPAIAFSQHTGKGKKKFFQVVGNIPGKDRGSLILSYMDSNNIRKRDTCPVQKRKFHFSGYIAQVNAALIYENGKKNILIEDTDVSNPIYLEPGKMTITIQRDNYKNAIVKGSKTEKENAIIEKKQMTIRTQRHLIKDQLMALKEELRMGKDSFSISEKRKLLMVKDDSLKDEMEAFEKNFIFNHPDSYVSADLLLFYFAVNKLNMDSAALLYSRFSDRVKECYSATSFMDKIKLREKNKIGNKATDFILKDINGSQNKLSDYKEGYVILFFTASWCGPCAAIYPQIQYLNSHSVNYHINIIGISLDKKREAWENSIKKHDIKNWKNLLLSEQTGELKKNFDVNGIPYIVLIDKNGIIKGEYLGENGERGIKELYDDIGVAFPN